MRKRNILSIIDHIVWLVVAFLPIIAYILVCCGNNNSLSTNILDYDDYISNIEDLNLLASLNFTSFDAFIISFFSENLPFFIPDGNTSNIFLVFFEELLASENSIFFCSSYGLILFLSWFCTIQLVHFIVDVLLFIPKICQKFVEIRG